MGSLITTQQTNQDQHKLSKDFFKRVILKFVGYTNPRAYWNARWKLGLNAEKWSQETLQDEFTLIAGLMKQYACQTILEVGCGKAHLRNLRGYVGLDYSLEALKKSEVNTFIYGDVSDKDLPIPNRSFDAVLTRFVLLHIPFERIEFAVENICRIAKKLIILKEPTSAVPKQTHFHCYVYDLPKLFERFDGKVVFLSSKKEAIVQSRVTPIHKEAAERLETAEKPEIIM